MGFILMAPKKRLEVASIFGVLIPIRVMRKWFVSWRQEKGNVWQISDYYRSNVSDHHSVIIL
jgi:hypothetical protein